MLEKLLSKTGQALWLILSCIAVLWIGYDGMVRHRGPLGWLEAHGYLNRLTALFVFAGSTVALWPLGFLCDFITRRGTFDKRAKTEFDTEKWAGPMGCANHTPILFESCEPAEVSGCSLPPWTSFQQSLRRVMFATLVAVPSTGVLAAAMLLVPSSVAFGIGLSGIVLFHLGKGLDRPILLAIGGVVMFAGLLSWGVRQ